MNNNFLQIDTFAMNFLNEKYFYTQVAQKFGNTEYEQIPEDTVKKQAFTFYSTPNRTYRTEDYIFLDSVAEYFHELIPGVHFYREKNKFELRVIEPKNKMEIGNKPGVFVDGVFYSDFNNLAKMPTEKLDYIEVLWEKYYYKDFVFDGIVSIHSKTSNFYAVDLQKNMTRVIYTLTDRNNIHFKSIIYAENNISSKLPDVRYLLYWNPEVDLANINNLNFYTSDVAGLYEIAISGFTLTGEWVTVTKEFHVQ